MNYLSEQRIVDRLKPLLSELGYVIVKQQKPVDKTCPICNTKFTTNYGQKKYCSAQCRTMAFTIKRAMSES